MAKKFIDADILFKNITDHHYLLVNYSNSKDYGLFTPGIKKAIDECPAADVQEVRHGHWILKNQTKLVLTDKVGLKEGFHYIDDNNVNKATIVLKKRINVKKPFCSVCGEHGKDEGDVTPYCPNCGAIMDGNIKYE